MQSVTNIQTVDILGFPVANVDMKEAVAAVAAMLEGQGQADVGESGAYVSDASGQSIRVVTANAEILYLSYKDQALGALLRGAELIVPDGAGVVKAAAMLGRPLKERVAGADLMDELSAWAADHGRGIYLLGAAKDSVEGAAAALQAKYPALLIAGIHDGYFDKKEKDRILREIQEKKPDFLFVGMGFPAQDRFFEGHKKRLPVGVMMGVGGTFDALSGKVKRAPGWIRRANLEWAYRFAQNPKRLGRIWSLPKFVIEVIRQKNREKASS